MSARRATAFDRLRYRALLLTLSPLLLLHTLWAGWSRCGGWRFVRQRLGWFGKTRPCDIWLHAASVGEVNAALPLLRRLLERHPDRQVLVTTNTPSGASALQRRLGGKVAHAYLPLDWSGAVARFLTRFRPGCALIMETELWPNLFGACRHRNVPLLVINARLSRRTLKAGPWVRRLYAEALAGVTAVLARADCDRAAYLRLGAPPERCRTIGNIKFAAMDEQTVAAVPLPRPYVLAASTRDGEEVLIASAWLQMESGGRLLVLVPRHPQRLPAILHDLEGLGVSPAVRSRGEPVEDATQVYIADTFGELTGFMAGADLVLMGGSLVPKGGQNLLEPAALGRPIVVGPHMENFSTETYLLREEGGLVQIDSAEGLGAALGALLADPGRLGRLGDHARAAVIARRDMAERYLEAIDNFCGKPLVQADGKASDSPESGHPSRSH